MKFKWLLQQLSSFLLPFTVLVLVPVWIEEDLSLKHPLALVAAILPLALGSFLLVTTVYTFIRLGNGTLAPWFPTRRLVVRGWYRYVRNPMISGVLWILTAESIAFASIRIAIWTLLFFLINNAFFLLYEEPDLERKFGKAYLAYKKKTPRWIPAYKLFRRWNRIKHGHRQK